MRQRLYAPDTRTPNPETRNRRPETLRQACIGIRCGGGCTYPIPEHGYLRPKPRDPRHETRDRKLETRNSKSARGSGSCLQSLPRRRAMRWRLYTPDTRIHLIPEHGCLKTEAQGPRPETRNTRHETSARVRLLLAKLATAEQDASEAVCPPRYPNGSEAGSYLRLIDCCITQLWVREYEEGKKIP